MCIEIQCTFTLTAHVTQWRGEEGYYFFLLLVFVWLLFEGDVHILGKAADGNDSWIRYTRVIQWRLLDTVSCTHSLAVLLSAVETRCTTQTALWLLSEMICVHVCVCAAYTSHGYYLRAVTLQVWRLFKERYKQRTPGLGRSGNEAMLHEAWEW